MNRRQFLGRVSALAGGILIPYFPGFARANYLYLPHRRKAFTVSGGNDSYTVLLAHMDGTDDAQVFTDSGAGANCPHTMTANGNVKTEDTQKKFGTTSAYFDGTGDYISIPDSADWAFGSGDFTIDFWVYFSALPANGNLSTLFTQYGDATNRMFFTVYNDAGTYQFQLTHVYAADNALNLTRDMEASVVDTWYHVAFVRTGNDFKIFQDGVQCGATNTKTETWGSFAASLLIGVYNAAAYPFNGYIDELRISKGIARWTANFTPPNAAYYE